MERLELANDQVMHSEKSGDTVLNRRQLIALSILGSLTFPHETRSDESTNNTATMREQYRKRHRWDEVLIEHRIRYPYSFSPLEFYAMKEMEICGKDADEQTLDLAITIANNIADKAADLFRDSVYQYMQGSPFMREYPSALQALGIGAGDRELLIMYVECIGKALLEAGRILKSEDLLSDACKPNDKNTISLDCDLLTYFVLHAAFRHDMPLSAYPAPGHMYVGSKKFRTLALEMTLLGRASICVQHADLQKCFSHAGKQRIYDYKPCNEEFLRTDIPQCIYTGLRNKKSKKNEILIEVPYKHSAPHPPK